MAYSVCVSIVCVCLLCVCVYCVCVLTTTKSEAVKV